MTTRFTGPGIVSWFTRLLSKVKCTTPSSINSPEQPEVKTSGVCGLSMNVSFPASSIPESAIYTMPFDDKYDASKIMNNQYAQNYSFAQAGNDLRHLAHKDNKCFD